MIVNIRDDDGDGVACRGSYQLYDLHADRFESRSVTGARPEALATMKAALDALEATAESPWFAVGDC